MISFVLILLLLGVGMYLHSDYESTIKEMWKVNDRRRVNQLLKSAERKKNTSTIMLVMVLIITIYQLITL
jgi:hypothetical protein